MNCCLECPDRYIGCHSKCEKYIKQSEEIKQWNEIRREEIWIDGICKHLSYKRRRIKNPNPNLRHH